MAWQRMRYRKSTGPLIMITERNGLGPAGAPGHVHSGGTGADPVAHVTPINDGPPAWPGRTSETMAAQVPAPREEGAEDSGVDFWDWAPQEQDPGSGAGEPDPAAPPVTPVPVPPEAAASGGSAGPAADDVPRRAEGIGSRFSSLGHIFGHSRMGMWRRRLLIGLALFILVTILVNWQVGVTLAVLVVIADTIIRARTVTAPAPAPGARRATKPQRMTQKQLAALEKAGYRALHSRLIPDSDEHIDHLVIGPAGVFAIDSEWWDKHLPIRTKNARQLWLGPFSMKDRLEHARWESDQAAALLSGVSGSPVTVRPVMAVYGPKIPWDVTTIRDVDVFSGKRLRTYLRRYARQNTARPLGPADVDRLCLAAHTAFPHLDPDTPAPSAQPGSAG